MQDLIVPKVGLTVETVEVLQWLKHPGDPVSTGEVVAELSADKANIEIESSIDGVLIAIHVAEGESADLGTSLATLGTAEEQAGYAAQASSASPVDAPPDPVAPKTDAASVAAAPSTSPAAPGDVLRVSPLARRVAERHELDLSTLSGSGPRGRIVRADVERALQAPAAVVAPTDVTAPAPAPANGLGLTAVTWTAARRATARRMAQSARTNAPVTLHRRASAERALAAAKRLKADGLPATFNHAVVAAAAGALTAHPAINAVWREEELLRAARVNVGVAVDVDGDLLLAVVPDADRHDIVGLVSAAAEAVARVRRRAPSATPPPEPTFTVSNLGMLGVEQFTPIISPPQVAILGVGSVVDGRCHLSLTFDHRAVDGAAAARFLGDVADRLAGFDGR